MTPLNFSLSFHHYGLAADDPSLALRFLSAMGYAVGASIYDPLQRVNLNWCVAPGAPAIEIVSPADSPGPLDSILKERDALVYHLCFESPRIEQSLAQIKEDGHRVLVVSPPKPAVLFGGRKVGFYKIKGFGLVELLEQ